MATHDYVYQGACRGQFLVLNYAQMGEGNHQVGVGTDGFDRVRNAQHAPGGVHGFGIESTDLYALNKQVRGEQAARLAEAEYSDVQSCTHALRALYLGWKALGIDLGLGGRVVTRTAHCVQVDGGIHVGDILIVHDDPARSGIFLEVRYAGGPR